MKQQQALTNNSPAAFAEKLGGRKILVVEDNSINRQVIRRILEICGVQVDMATNGQEAVEMMNNAYAALLMDVEMPILDGLAATRQIRSRQQFTHIPIIAMTGYDHDSDQQRCLQAGMTAFLVKPITTQSLLTTLQHHINQEGDTKQRQEGFQDNPPTKLLILNRLTGLKNLRGDHLLYQEILHDFLRVHTGIIEKIGGNIEKNETEEAQRVTHLLKGVAGTIKAEILEEEARQLNNLLRSSSPSPQQITAQFNKLSPIFNDTREAISAYLAEQ